MSSTFTDQKNSKQLNSGTVKPQALAKLFGIELSSLSVLNNETGELHDVEGGMFAPPLPSSGNFEVYGKNDQITSPQPPPVTPQSTAISSKASMAVVKREQLIADVIQDGQNMNESTIMLHHAPQAVILMENLTILAACTRDPSLVSADNPASKFVRLKCPTSFKACLYQVACNISNAFRTADTMMNRIHLALIDLPDYFQSTLEAVANPNDSGAQEVMQFTLSTIENASKTCLKAAEESVKAFDGVIMDIDELVESSLVCKTVSERQQEANAKMMEDLKIKKEQRANELAENERVYAERKERVDKALKDYNTEMESMRDIGSLFAAAFADFLLDSLSSSKDLISTFASEIKPTTWLKETVKGIAGKGDERHSGAFLAAAEATLVTILEKVEVELENPETLAASCDELISALEAGVKFGGRSEMGKCAAKEAKTMIKFLEDAKKKPPLPEEIAKSKASLTVLFNLMEETKRQEAKEREAKEQKGEKARESLVQVGKRLDSAQSRYKQEDEAAEKLRKELSETRREMAALAGRLATLDLENVDLDDVVKYLTEGIMTLSHVKECWGHVALFFQNINEVVSGPLKRNMAGFIEKAQSKNAVESSIIQQELLRLSLKSCGLCTQISACARIYTQVSQKHILPVINGVGQNLALTRDQAKSKRMQIPNRVTNAQDDVEMLVNQHLATAKATVQAQIAQYAENYSAAMVRRN